MGSAEISQADGSLAASLLERAGAIFTRELKSWIDRLNPADDRERKLSEAMAYSLLAPGKRLRPALCIEVCRALGGRLEIAYAAGCAIEMIHTYSLIHDDLPCMDNDDLRRGRPSNHKVYGDALALLAGDALLTFAFEVLSSDHTLSPDQAIESVRVLSSAAGPSGMVLGQVLDMELTGSKTGVDERLVAKIHRTKTGRLISAACELGSVAARATSGQQSQVREFGEVLGLAFQIVDDILDVIGGEKLGKPKGSDEKLDKLTMVRVLGLDESKRRAEDLIRKTNEMAGRLFPGSREVHALVEFVLRRTF